MGKMMNKPTYAHTLAILPEVRAADAVFWQKMEGPWSNSTEANDAYYREIVEELNKVLEKAIQAIYEDTKDRNSKSTLEQFFRAREPHHTHFGIDPVKSIEDFIHYEELPIHAHKGRVSKDEQHSAKHS
jgi:hypothetical protein